ncbi:hypothetical protein [Streptomyces sp. NPDC005141]
MRAASDDGGPLPRGGVPGRPVDVTITVGSGASRSRRFTGHLETGAASVSG